MHAYDLTNVTAASLLLTQTIGLWLVRLASEKSYPSTEKPAKRVRPFLRLHEFEEDEFVFHPDGEEGEVDGDGLPHGKGLLRFETSSENQESCVGNACEGTLYG